MILTCPSCAANFLIDPAKLGAGARTVRCGKCRNEWQAQLPIITLPADDTDIIPEHVLRPVEAAAAKTRLRIGKRNAVVAALVLATLFALPVFFALQPKKPDAPYEDAANASGGNPKEEASKDVVLDGVPKTLLKQEQGRDILIIEGALLNKGATRQKTPGLMAQALNARRRVVKEWDVPISTPELEPGQRLPFSFSTPFSEQGIVDIAFHFK